MPRYVISLGSSHIAGITYLNAAQNAVQKNRAMKVVAESRIYKNKGSNTEYNCLCYNSALAVETILHPHAFYRELFRIEHRLGRIRSYRNALRTIDIDVLLSLDLEYMSSHFFVPHRALWERNFFVIPAIEALRSAGWPVHVHAFKSAQNFGAGFLKPVI